MTRTMDDLFWLGCWILAHAVAFAIALAIDFTIVANSNMVSLILPAGVISGCCSGSVEAWLLRGRCRRPGWLLAITILATPLGIIWTLAVFCILFRLLGEGIQSLLLQVIILGLCVGMVVGMFQAPFLRCRLSYALGWIAIAALSRSIGWVAGVSLFNGYGLANEAVLAALSGALGGAIYGTITGRYLQQAIPLRQQTASNPKQGTIKHQP